MKVIWPRHPPNCRHWLSGDVYPSSGLRASVAARTYRGELIVIGESRTNPFMQVGLFKAESFSLRDLRWENNVGVGIELVRYIVHLYLRHTLSSAT